jgi:hypothetical protein
MSLSVTEPAPVSLPPAAKTAVVVNRSRAADDSRIVDAIHRTAGAESRQLQTEGSAAGVTGLTDALINSNRFASVKALNELDLRSYATGEFPVTMSWDTVEKICRDNHADLLFSLELFDVQSQVPLAIMSMGRVINTKVRTGWRIYDPVSHSVLDKWVYYSDLSIQGGVVANGMAMLGHKEEVIKAGHKCGASYASRIIPYSVRVSRVYFVRGNRSFGIATRMARAGDWAGAGRIWHDLATNSRSRKLTGRADYNMAIISEINGDLNGALTWAQKAYEIYQTPYALSYINILQQRQSNDAVLKNQTELTSN